MRRIALLLAAVAVLLGLAGCTVAGHPRSAATAPAPRVAEPVALTIDSLELSASLDKTGLNPDGTVAVPALDHPERAAWVDVGPTPGQVGRALIVGHINGGGHPGVFADLATVKPGADVTVTDADGNDHRFVVTRIGQAPKTAFPAGAVYGDTDKPELVLVTCGGDLDRAAHSYVDNTIVFARAA